MNTSSQKSLSKDYPMILAAITKSGDFLRLENALESALFLTFPGMSGLPGRDPFPSRCPQIPTCCLLCFTPLSSSQITLLLCSMQAFCTHLFPGFNFPNSSHVSSAQQQAMGNKDLLAQCILYLITVLSWHLSA